MFKQFFSFKRFLILKQARKVSLSEKRFSNFISIKNLKSVLRNTINSTLFVSKRKFMDLTSVIKIFEQHVPPNLAEKWDNTGLLVEPSVSKNVSTIIFTNDLTKEVLEEAICLKSDLIVSYHPPIFSPIKSLRQSNWKDQILMMCIQNSIAVYSPHTCCDAVSGGVNDWLINCFDVSDVNPIIQSYQNQTEFTHVIEFSWYLHTFHPKDIESIPNCKILSVGTYEGNESIKVEVNETSMKCILRDFGNSMKYFCATPLSPLPLMSHGMGRKGKLVESLPLNECVELIKKYLNLSNIRLAKAVSHSFDTPVSVIAVCAGSGASVLKGVAADLYITGEMSHHDLLDATHRNVSVVLCEHSNSERGYLLNLVKLLSPRLNGIKLILSSSDKDPVSIV